MNPIIFIPEDLKYTTEISKLLARYSAILFYTTVTDLDDMLWENYANENPNLFVISTNTMTEVTDAAEAYGVHHIVFTDFITMAAVIESTIRATL